MNDDKPADPHQSLEPSVHERRAWSTPRIQQQDASAAELSIGVVSDTETNVS